MVTPSYTYTYNNKKVVGKVAAQPVTVDNVVYVTLLGVVAEADYDVDYNTVVAVELDVESEGLTAANVYEVEQYEGEE